MAKGSASEKQLLAARPGRKRTANRQNKQAKARKIKKEEDSDRKKAGR